MTTDGGATKMGSLILSLLATVGAALGDEPRLPVIPEDYAAIVRPQLPPTWHCIYDFRTLIISCDEQATYLNGIGLPSQERNDKLFKEHGVQAPYIIVMKFVSRLSEAEQQVLAKRRQQAVTDARKGREHEKYSGFDVYERYFVPEYYNNRFSIDMQTSDSFPLELVAPADVVKQRDAILKILHANLKAYPVQR